MVGNYLIFFVSYFLIVLSVVGHGVLAIKLTKSNVSIEEIGFVGLVGIFFLILYSYLSHFFVSLGYLFFLFFFVVVFVGFFFFCLFFFFNFIVNDYI